MVAAPGDNASEPILRLSDLFRHGGHLRCPEHAVSLYRYVEHLVAASLVAKYGLETVLEIGPGTDSLYDHVSPSLFASAAMLDYSKQVLDGLADRPWAKGVEAIHADAQDAQAFAGPNRTWSFIYASALLEHLEDDALLVRHMQGLLEPGGVILATTVLSPRLYNIWDHAVGHYRRYTGQGLRKLFGAFRQVQIIQSSLIQELVRPLFFSRVKHLRGNSIEENNRLFAEEHLGMGRPPYAPVWGLLKWFMPLYLIGDWALRDRQGGIGIVVARS
jgi:SAM-dependent methyltransferase